jgi:hypothetical protein
MSDSFDDDPRLEDRDTVVIFEADIPKYAINAKGRLVLTLEVVDADKYLAMPITDIQGRRFTIRAYAATTRAPRLRAKMEAARVAMQPASEWERLMLVLTDPAPEDSDG